MKEANIYMKEKLNYLKDHIKAIDKKTFIMAASVIIVTFIIIGVALHFKNRPSSNSSSEGKVTLGKYEGIPLTLEKTEITDDTIKETAEWSISYYNQGLEEGEKKLKLDTLTDEQVKKAFDMDSVEAFYDSIREYEEENDKKQSRTNAYDQICEYLLENCTIEKLPEDTLKARIEKYLKDTEESCKKYYDMTFAEYCESVNMTEDEYRKSLSEHVEKTFKQELILVAIADKENIQYDEKNYESYIEDLITNGGYDSKEAVYEQYGEDYLKTAYRVEDVVDWIIEKADITYVPDGTKDNKDTQTDEVNADIKEETTSK